MGSKAKIIGLILLLVASFAIAETQIQFKQGNEADLPATAAQGEPLWTRDTNKLFIGNSSSRIQIGGPHTHTTFGNLSAGKITAESVSIAQGSEAQSLQLLEALANGGNSATVAVSDALAADHTLLITDSGLMFDGAAIIGLTADQKAAIDNANIPNAGNPLATINDITAAGYTSSYIFCEDDQSGTVPTTTINTITRVWHELEKQSDGGAVGSHTATGTAYTEMDRYVTQALNTTIIPGGTWRFTFYVNLNAVQKEGTLKADIYRIGSDGAVISLLGTATTPAFINTVILPVQASVYITQQTGWNATDRIGVVVSGKRGVEGGATATWYHNAAAGHASIMETPVTLLHNQMQGLNEGDYKHLTGTEKTRLDNLSAPDIAYSNPTYTTVGAALDKLLYVNTAITSYTMSNGGNVEQEYGTSYTITGSGLVWATNKTTLTTQTINGTARTSPYMPSPATVSNNTSYALSVSDGTTSASSTRSVTFSWRRHWAPSTILRGSFTSANILSMGSNEFGTSHTRTITYDCTGGRYPTFAFPSSYGTPTAVKVGGLAFSDFGCSTVSHTNASGGGPLNYLVCQFNNLQTGAAIVVEWD